MKAYRLNDEVLTAESDQDFVNQLMAVSQTWQPSANLGEFMEKFANRAKLQTGKDVRIDSAENFIGDLVRCGILKE